MESLSGKLIIATPKLPDPNFHKSVVLIVQHDDEGALGLILNRPSDRLLAEIWTELTEVECDRQEPIMLGGPVDGPVMALHGCAAEGEIDVLPGVHFSSDKDHLLAVVAQREQPVRVFVGYAGWGPQQLDAEWEHGSWLVHDADAESVFSEPTDLWKRTAARVGDDILFGGRFRPGSPGMN